MRLLHGRIDPIGRPFIRAVVDSAGLAEAVPIDFLLDTGAEHTLILDLDRIRHRIETKTLERTPRGSLGLGGRAPTYVMPSSLSLETADGGLYSVPGVEIRVVDQGTRDLSEDLRRSVLTLPSLLGRDVIRLFRVSLDLDGGHLTLEF